MIYVDENNFELEVLKSDKPVLVDFFAEWCGPCQMMSPVINEIAENIEDVKVCKCDIDNSPGLAVTYNVMSIPTLILFKNGEIVKRQIGALPKQAILDMLG